MVQQFSGKTRTEMGNSLGVCLVLILPDTLCDVYSRPANTLYFFKARKFHSMWLLYRY